MGRWGSWEYLNSDQVILQAYDQSKKFINEKNKKIILITGVAGMLGSELTSKLIKKKIIQ